MNAGASEENGKISVQISYVNLSRYLNEKDKQKDFTPRIKWDWSV